MSEQSNFFNSINRDRPYDAEDFAAYMAKFFTNGIFNNGLQVVSSDGMSVALSEGIANINGYRYKNDSNKTLNIANADGILNRIDNIVIRLDLPNRKITAEVIQGEFSEEAVAPELVRDNSIYDLRIAKISIPAGTTEIKQELIEDTRLIANDCGNVICAVQTPDFTNILLQYETIWTTLIDNQTGEYNTWFEAIKALETKNEKDRTEKYNKWYENIVDTYNKWYGDITTEYEEEKEQLINNFQTWFENCKATLDENVAGNLLNLINTKASQQDLDTFKEEVTETVNTTLNKHIKSKVTDEEGIHGIRITSKCMIQAQDENGNWFNVANGALSNNELFKPYQVSNIKAAAGKNKIVLSWSDPEDKIINDNGSGEVITAKWSNTKVVMKTGGYPTNVQDGTLVVDNNEKDKYKENGYEITSLNNNTTYYIRFFTYSDLDSVNDSEESKVEATPSLLKPNKCTNISVKVGNGKAVVSWTDPEDSSKDSEICTWAGTKLVIKKGSYPTSQNDGTIEVDSTVRNQYSKTGYEIVGLENDTTYYGQLFPYSTDGAYNTDEENRFEATPKSVTVYGVKKLKSSSSTEWTRIEGAESLQANAVTASNNIETTVNDFDNLYPWSEIISVDMSKDGTINKRYGDPDFSFTNPTGLIMTYVPEFWYKRTEDSQYYYLYIADAQYEDYEHSPAYYGSRYNAGGSTSALDSKSGRMSLGNTTPANFRTAAKKLGDNWGLFDIWSISALQILYLVEYADFNAQLKLGYGICSGSQTASGGCDSLGMKSGCLKNDKKSAVIYRGFENPYGNEFYFIDAVNISNYQAYVNKNRETYACDKFDADYKKLGYTCINSSAYIKELGYDSNYPCVMLGKTGGGSDSTYIPDYHYANSGNRVVWFGGHYDLGLACGFWFWYCYDGSSYNYSVYCARLLYVPVE